MQPPGSLYSHLLSADLKAKTGRWEWVGLQVYKCADVACESLDACGWRPVDRGFATKESAIHPNETAQYACQRSRGATSEPVSQFESPVAPSN